MKGSLTQPSPRLIKTRFAIKRLCALSRLGSEKVVGYSVSARFCKYLTFTVFIAIYHGDRPEILGGGYSRFGGIHALQDRSITE